MALETAGDGLSEIDIAHPCMRDECMDIAGYIRPPSKLSCVIILLYSWLR